MKVKAACKVKALVVAILVAFVNSAPPVMARAEDSERKAQEAAERRKLEAAAGDKRRASALSWVLQYMDSIENDPRVGGVVKLGNRNLINNFFQKDVVEVYITRGFNAGTGTFGKYYEPGARYESILMPLGLMPDKINPLVALLELDADTGTGPNLTSWHETVHGVIYQNGLRNLECMGKTNLEKEYREEAYTWLLEERLKFLENYLFPFAAAYEQAKAETDPARRAIDVPRINQRIESQKAMWQKQLLGEGPGLYKGQEIDPACVKHLDQVLGMDIDLLKIMRAKYPPLSIGPQASQAPTDDGLGAFGTGWNRRIENQTAYAIPGMQVSTNPDTGADRFTFVDGGHFPNDKIQGAVTLEISKLPDRIVAGQQYSISHSIVREDVGCAGLTSWIQWLPDGFTSPTTPMYRPGAQVSGGYYGRPGRYQYAQPRNPSGTVSFVVPKEYLDPRMVPASPQPYIKFGIRCKNGASVDVFYTYNGRPHRPGGGSQMAAAQSAANYSAAGDTPRFSGSTDTPRYKTPSNWGAPVSTLGTPSQKPSTYVPPQTLGTPSQKPSTYVPPQTYEGPSKISVAPPKVYEGPAKYGPGTGTAKVSFAAQKQELRSKYQAYLQSGGREAAQKYVASEAAAGNASAQEQMGLTAFDQKNYADAKYWFEKAAQQGEPNSQNNLGNLYFKGNGVARDYKRAFIWISRAAQQGVPQAQTSLGAMYVDGVGVPKDRNEGIRWLKMAARNGSKNAEEILDKMDVDDD